MQHRISESADVQEAIAKDGTPLYFRTVGSARKPAIFLGPHFYASDVKGRSLYADKWIDALAMEFFVIAADYPRGIGKTKNSLGFDLTADIVCDDYVSIADKAGVQTFGWFGYSFGGAVGLQLACRTDSVSALVIGGFPPLSAPYAELVQILNTAIDARELDRAQMLRSAIGFYSSLKSWPEREEVCSLLGPKLLLMGDKDCAEGLPESNSLPLAEIVREEEAELRALGWDIVWLAGQDHGTAQRPDLSVGKIREFFNRALT
jgi:pimeloyl-ACP methyl ester carboxylesterase